MAKKDEGVKVEEDLIEGAEDIEPSGDELGGLGDLEAEALEEPTGEEEVTEDEAAAAVEGKAAGQKITIALTEAPQFEGMNPGDEIQLITTFRILRKTDTDVDVETIDFMPVEEMEEPLEEGTAAPVAPSIPGALPGGGGGLAPIV